MDVELCGNIVINHRPIDEAQQWLRFSKAGQRYRSRARLGPVRVPASPAWKITTNVERLSGPQGRSLSSIVRGQVYGLPVQQDTLFGCPVG
ncbi:hypothetical protein [Streptomyces uncialis]|uniref:hypothetical protein n=1 Tax=Streptomyces uncialis TaxID=1048205 RepID=UPI0033E384B8